MNRKNLSYLPMIALACATLSAQAQSEGTQPFLPIAAAAPAAEPLPPGYAAQSAAMSRTRAKWAGAGVALVVILALLLFMAYRTFTERLQAARNTDTATALIESADVIVVQVDTVVRSEVTSGLAEQARVAAAQVPEATRQLQRAVALLEASSQGTTLDDEQRSAELLDAAKARLDMMEQAPTILRLNQASSEALVPAREGWDGLIAADQKSDRAVAEYNRLTKAGVQRSRTLNKEVAGELAAAREKLALAEQLFPEGPFEEYLAYVDLRISLNQLSQQADAAWLAGNVRKANSIITNLNTQEATAIARAKTLPETPEKAIADAYVAAARQATEAYYRARDAATDADKQLR
jgi:hypothetical protein